MDDYCVYLTCYLGNKLPPFYIGSTTTIKVQSGYKGSVKSKQYKKIFEYETLNNSYLLISLYHQRPQIDHGYICKNGKIMTYEQAFSKTYSSHFKITPQAIKSIISCLAS